MSIPKVSGKLSGDKLSGVAQRPLSDLDVRNIESTVMFSGSYDEMFFDFLLRPKKSADKLFVLLSGDALREKNNPPVFQRWSWAKFFPGHCLYVSDPSLYMDSKLSLAWYVGSEKKNPMSYLVDRIKTFAQQLNVSERSIYFYGSSGGGFAALKLLEHFADSCAIVINPQVVITDYNNKKVDYFLDKCFGGKSRLSALTEFEQRLSAVAGMPRLFDRRIIYAQNRLDSHHHDVHYKKFCDAYRLDFISSDKMDHDNISRIVFYDENGHKTAEDQDTFNKILEYIELGF